LYGCQLRAQGLNLDQFLPASQNHLPKFLEATFQFSQSLFGVAIGSVLDCCGFLAAVLNQRFALLLSLLAVVQGILMETFGFALSLLLQAKAFLSDLLKILHRL